MYCARELPSTIEQVSREYRGRGLAVVAVNIEEPKGHVQAWVASRRVTVPVALDSEGSATRAWRVGSTPTVFLVGRDGRLVARGSGTRPWTSAQGRALLDALAAPR